MRDTERCDDDTLQESETTNPTNVSNSDNRKVANPRFSEWMFHEALDRRNPVITQNWLRCIWIDYLNRLSSEVNSVNRPAIERNAPLQSAKGKIAMGLIEMDQDGFAKQPFADLNVRRKDGSSRDNPETHPTRPPRIGHWRMSDE